MPKLLPLFWWIGSLLHYGVEGLLSYLVGAPVHIRQITALSISLQGAWQIQMDSLRIQSTLRGDTFPVASLCKAFLSGQGLRLDSVSIRSGSVSLVRLGKGQKNFRLFPKRGQGKRVQDFAFHAESLRLYLANHPPGMFLNISIQTVSGRLCIDSLFVHITGGHALLYPQEVCIAGARQPFPDTVHFSLAGTYEKSHDLWSHTKLLLSAPAGLLHYEGAIAQWEVLHGYLSGFLQAGFLSHFLAPAEEWLGNERVFFVGWINQSTYEARLSGSWQEGCYDLCLSGEGKRLREIDGIIKAENIGHFWVKGSLESLRVKGALHARGLSAELMALVDLPAQTGIFTVRDQNNSSLHIYGSSQQFFIRGRLGGRIPFRGKWQAHQELFLYADTVSIPELIEAVQPYRGLMGGGGAVSLRAHIKRLLWGEYGTLTDAEVESQGGRFFLTALAQPTRFPFTVQVRVWGQTSFTQGGFAAQAPEGYLYGTWQGDSFAVSGLGRWEDVIIAFAAQGATATQHLQVHHAVATFPTGEKVHLRGVLSADSVDAQLQGALPVPWILRYLPLSGVEVRAGRLSLALCAQGTWDTLLRWDNPTEGTVVLEAVEGNFPKLGLPLHELTVCLSYAPEKTIFHRLSGQVGKLTFRAEGEVMGALSYLYTDWYRLQGRLRVEADHLVISDFWRRVERDEIRPKARLPSQLHAQMDILVRNADIFGLSLQNAHVVSYVEGLTITIDTIIAEYSGALAQGRLYLDAQDSSCYFATGKIAVSQLPLQTLIQEIELDKVATFQRVGLRGYFSGQMQFNLRFSPEVKWLRQSSMYANGNISNGSFHTPRFLRWFRPYYLSSYKDSMDFYAQVYEVAITDGFMRLSKALLVSRVAAMEISGYHYLMADRFLYRIQAVRVRRRVQRYPDLAVMVGVFSDLIDRSFGLVYVEKNQGKVRWHYPWRYAVRRLLFPRGFL